MRYLSVACVLALVLGLGLSTVQLTVLAADEPEGWGTVKGQIVFGPAAVPAPKGLNVDKDQDTCLAKSKNLFSQEWVINAKNKGVRWAYAWLTPLKNGEKIPVHPDLAKAKLEKVEIDQPSCQFEPHAIAIRQGQVVVFKNGATINHNVNWSGGSINPGSNISLPPGKSIEVGDLKASRIPVSVSCNIHGWMKGWIRVFDHPYFAVTNSDGEFEIKQAPAGKYRLVIWHEGAGWGPGGKEGQEVEIKAKGTTDLGKVAVKPAE
jgi:plastocyanin